MARYFKKFILFIIPLFFLSFDVNAESFSSVSTRFVFYSQGGQKIDNGFSSSTTISLPQSVSSTTTGPISWRTFQWRYTTSSTLQANKKYRITTDFVFSSLDGQDVSINNFLNPIIGDIGCGTRYNNSYTSNLELHEVKVSRINDLKFRLYYDITPKVSTCNFFSGIYGYGNLDSFNSDYIVNEPTTENGLVTMYISYQLLESSSGTSNSDIIANQDKNTQDIIDNNNSNTQDIIDSQDKINDSLNDDNVDSDVGTGFFDDFNDEDFGLSEIITIPLDTITSLTSKTCQPLSIPIPKTGKNINLPCMTQIYQENIPSIFSIWQIVSFGIIAYFVAIDIFHLVKGFKDPESDKVEVLDL